MTDDICNKRREKLERAVRVAALELLAHMGGAAGTQCDLGNGLKLTIGPDASMSPSQEMPSADESQRPFAGLTKKLEESGFIGPTANEPLGGRLPSRFQLHDTVRAQGARGTVVAITFMLVDGWGKVAYDVDCGAQTLHRVLSDDVQPAQPSHLKPVPVAPDSKG